MSYVLLLCNSSDASDTLQSLNGLGLKAVRGRDDCEVVMQFPSDTVPKWVSSQ